MISQQDLESHLWGAADILRGSIDSADYKHYIFGLLFYKRLCDVWEEEYEDRLRKYKDEDVARDPDEHRFHVPPGSFWSDIRKKSKNIGESLNIAFRAIEDHNKRIHGVFQDVDFNNKERFPDAILQKLLQHFDKYRLRNTDVTPDILGNAYEYLIGKFADDAGKKGGEFYTPKEVVRLIVECIEPGEGMSIYDPACGSGGMLLEAFHYLEKKGKNTKSLKLYGQERNLNTWAICQMNLFLHDIDDAFIEKGDTLRDPKHLAGNKTLKTFERVMANPPFSLDSWGHDEWKIGDKFGRDKYGCPPKSYGDLAFVQHMVASLSSKGKMGVVLPHGILFRGGSEGKIREGLIQDDLIDAVIGIAPNLFYGTTIPACILIISREKPKSHMGQILFVNGADEFTAGKNQNRLSDAHVRRLASAYHDYSDEKKFSRVVPTNEIQQNEFSLNISRYVNIGGDQFTIDVRAEFEKMAQSIKERDKAEAKMIGYLRELGYGS